jgi:hypothetical protein
MTAKDSIAGHFLSGDRGDVNQGRSYTQIWSRRTDTGNT